MTDEPFEEESLVKVFETTDVALLPVIESVLQAAEIPFMVQGETGFGMLPVGDMNGPFVKHGLSARVMVPEGRAGEASRLLEEANEIPDPPAELQD